MADDSTVRCHCNRCSGTTDHDILAERLVEDDDHTAGDEQQPFWWTDKYQMLQCRGCRAVSLRDEYNDATKEHRQITYYPPRVFRRSPPWSWQLPKEMREVLDETYVAVQNDGRRLALMGARTLVDMLMLAEIGDGGTFQEKLRKLQSVGVISERGREVLSVALDAGSAAAHRGYKPAVEDLSAVMDIVENLLQATYHLKKVAARVKTRTPSRSPRPKNKP